MISNRTVVTGDGTMKWLVVALFWTLCGSTSLLGQDQYLTKYLLFNDKSLGITTAIESDRDGFVWIATGQGLLRFDGTNFVPARQLIDELPEMGAQIQELHVDQHNRLWIFKSTFGLLRIQLDDFTWDFYPEFNRNQETSYYYSIYEHPTHGIFVPHQKGVAHYIEDADSFDIIELEEPRLGVRFISGAGDNLIFSTRRRAFRYSFSNGTIDQLTALTINEGTLADLCVDTRGDLWISNWYSDDNGLLRYDLASDRIVDVFGPTVGQQHYVSNTDIWEILPTQDGVYFASNSGGLWQYDYSSSRCIKIERDEGLLTNNTNQIRSVHLDKFGRLWQGGSIDVYYQILATKKIERISKQSNPPLETNNIFTVNHIGPRSLAIGSDQGLLMYDDEDGTVRQIEFPRYNGNVYNNHINHIFIHENHIWLGTWSSLIKLDPSNLRVAEHYITFSNAGTNHEEHLMKFEIGAVLKTQVDSKGDLWIINSRGELVQMKGESFNRSTQIFEFATEGEECLDLDLHKEYGLLALTEYDIYSVESDVSGMVRLSTNIRLDSLQPVQLHTSSDLTYLVVDDGLYRGRLLEDSFLVSRIPSSDSNRALNHLTIENDSIAWTTEQDGLVRWNLNSGRSSSLDSELHLYSSSINRIINVEKLSVSDAGELYMASNSGVIVVDAKRFGLDQSVPKVIITSVRTDGSTPTRRPVHRLEELVLGHDQNNLQLEVSVLNSAEPATTSYRYRLQKDQKWLDVGAQALLSLSGLAPGNYNLEVDAASGDGVRASSPAQLKIRIKPPWYRTTLASTAYLLLASFIIYIFYRFRLSTALAREEMLKVRELDQFKNRFFTNITHEFRTPLTVIQGMASKISQAPEIWSSRGARLIQRNSQTLLNLINQILDLSKVEQGMLSVQMLQDDIVRFLRQLTASMQSYAESSNQILTFEGPSTAINMDFDKQHLETIVSNLISNAIKYSDEPGEIIVKISKDKSSPQNFLSLEVIDQGVGIQESQLEHIFERFHRVKQNSHQVGTGIGLALTRELVEKTGGQITVSSNVGVGTSFRVLLPISQDAPRAESSRMLKDQALQIDDSAAAVSLVERELTALVVEDNDDVAEFILSVLEPHYQVHRARHGQQGLDMALQLIPDVVVSDVMMPVMDGVKMLSHIRSDNRINHLPVILLTAKVGVENRLAGLREGADAYLAKPFHEEELKVILDRLIKQREVYRVKFGESRTLTPTPAGKEQKNVAYIQELRGIVLMHLDDATFGVGELAHEAHLSARQLSRKLKAISAYTPNQLIKEVRINRAKELLGLGDKTITEISTEVGFGSVQYFSTVFRKEVGLSPGDYRAETV